MLILPIHQKAQQHPKLKTPSSHKYLCPLETKCTQFPEIGTNSTKPTYSSVKQYILDSQLLTSNNCNININSKPIRTLYYVKSVLMPKTNSKKTLSTQQSSFNPKDSNTSNECFDYKSQHIKTSFSSKLIAYNSNNNTCDGGNKKGTRTVKGTPSTGKLFSIQRKKLFICNEKRKAHDVNVYNRVYYNDNLHQNYVRNAYKIAKMFQSAKFINQIKFDLKSLKYNNQLKLVDN